MYYPCEIKFKMAQVNEKETKSLNPRNRLLKKLLIVYSHKIGKIFIY